MLPALYAMRILVDGLIAEAEVRAPPVVSPADVGTGTCPHPPERQVDASTLGGVPEVVCLVCGQQRMGVAP